MSIRRSKIIARCVVPLLTAAVVGTVCFADKPKGRTVKEVNADYAAVEKEWAQNVRFPETVLFNPMFKPQMSGLATGLTQKKRDLVAEMMDVEPKKAPDYLYMLAKYDAELAYFGDAPAAKRLDDLSADSDKTKSQTGKLGQLLVDWWNSKTDEARTDIAAKAEAIATADPASNAAAATLIIMLKTHPEDVAIGKSINDLESKMKAPEAKTYTASPLRLDAPIAVDGSTLKGEAWKLDKFKGKVVMVDFWATWCPPCREEIPHVAKLYADYHDKGFEIIGVSSDNDKAELTQFLKDHPEMPWPELFHAGNGWHPLTKKFGITGIPTMYIVDRNGLLRSVAGREEMDTLVPKLLDEPYTPEEKPVVAKPAAKPAVKPIGT